MEAGKFKICRVAGRLETQRIQCITAEVKHIKMKYFTSRKRRKP